VTSTLRIEPILAYSPVNPDDDERNPYRRDCLRNMDHEDGTIPDPEVIARTLDALVYREYVDGTYTTPDIRRWWPRTSMSPDPTGACPRHSSIRSQANASTSTS